MRSFNVALAILVSLLLAAAVLEIGLRVLGLGPQPTINRFEPSLGWVKTPGATSVRKTREFDVRYTINSLGLRDDEMSSPAKPAGTYRVVMLGDSFVLGYTVDRSDLFVDLLEQWWKREGRAVDVINAGTEGWSTDQEAAWLLDHGREFQPDLVVLFPYENDIYWNGEIRYLRVPKPRFTITGEKEMRVLDDPGERSKVESSALGKLFLAKPPPPALWSPDGIHALQGEQQVYFEKPDPSFEKEAIGRTRGSLIAVKKQCDALGAKLVAVPIPNKACVDADARPKLAAAINALSLRQSLMFWKDHPDVDPKTWSPDRPVDTFVRLCGEVGIDTLDPREFLRSQAHASAENAEGRLYYAQDWHFDPHGNRALARYLHKELDEDGLVPKAPEGGVVADLPPRVETKELIPAWAKLFAALWVVLSVGYALTYRDEPKALVPIKVGALLGLVFTIAIGGGFLLGKLPRGLSMLVGFAFVAGVLTFVAVKLGRRLKTITELFACFVGRGHWYLMPLVVVLLTVGSLLVVAASSPLIAPFIYTLF